MLGTDCAVDVVLTVSRRRRLLLVKEVEFCCRWTRREEGRLSVDVPGDHVKYPKMYSCWML